jgi:hypothetical protein
MTIKTMVIKTNTKDIKEYPYIGISDRGTSVLFISSGSGISLGGNDWGVGKFDTAWAESEFRLLSGSITLTQE